MNSPRLHTHALLLVSFALAFVSFAPIDSAHAQTAQPTPRTNEAADKKAVRGEAETSRETERSVEQADTNDATDKPKRDKKDRKGEKDSERELEEEEDI